MEQEGNKIHKSAQYGVSLSASGKNLLVAYLFWWFLGFVGAHRFYLDRVGSALVMIALLVLGFFTFFTTWLVLGIWWLIDGYLTYKYVAEANTISGLPSLGFNLFTNASTNVVGDGIWREGDAGYNSSIEVLEKLSKLKDSGVLTQAEFDTEKAKIMNKWKA
jgi:TM2 domain-containing membrane protein YozV